MKTWIQSKQPHSGCLFVIYGIIYDFSEILDFTEIPDYSWIVD